MAIALIIGATSLFAAETKPDKNIVELGLEIDGVLLPMGLLDARFNVGPVILDFGVGFVTARMIDPTIQITDSEGYDSGEITTNLLNGGVLNLYGTAFQGGVLVPYWRPANMKVYSGVKMMIASLGGSMKWEDYDESVKIHGTMCALKLVALGWDFKIPGVDNLVFSTSVGFKRSWIPALVYNEEAGSDWLNVKIDPNLSGWSTDFTFGARVAF